MSVKNRLPSFGAKTLSFISMKGKKQGISLSQKKERKKGRNKERKKERKKERNDH